MSDFRRDDEWQKSVRDAVLAPGYYGSFCVEGRFVFIDKGDLATDLQRQFAVDTIAQGKDGRAVCIEEKIVRWPGYVYTAYTLETDSCTRAGREKQGWMHYGRADFLLYCFVQPRTVECHLIDFAKLKAWFWPRVDSFDTFGPLPTLNATAGRKVPIAAVEREVGMHKRILHPDPAHALTPVLFPELARAA